jgi:hypothetical protein
MPSDVVHITIAIRDTKSLEIEFYANVTSADTGTAVRDYLYASIRYFDAH